MFEVNWPQVQGSLGKSSISLGGDETLPSHGAASHAGLGVRGRGCTLGRYPEPEAWGPGTPRRRRVALGQDLDVSLCRSGSWNESEGLSKRGNLRRV